AEARRIYAVLAETQEERATRQLVEFIRGRGGKAAARDLCRSNARKYPTAEVAETALQGLVQAGLGAWGDPPAKKTGRPPARVCVLQPTSDKTDKTPEDDDIMEPEASDKTPDETEGDREISNVPEGFVGFVGCRTVDQEGAQAPGEPAGFCRAPEGPPE